MIQETNFNDIRRNFILASLLLIVFLIYGSEIKVEQLLIFKFEVNKNWAIFTPYKDILIILLLFFIYTGIRYYIYGIEEIKKYGYTRLLLIDVLDNISGKNYPINNGEVLESVISNKTPVDNEFDNVTFSIHKDEEKIILIGVFYTLSGRNNSFSFSIPNNSGSIILKNNYIEFDGLKMKFKKNIKKLYSNRVFNVILKREFSDFLWPLFLIIPIILLGLFKVIKLYF